MHILPFVEALKVLHGSVDLSDRVDITPEYPRRSADAEIPPGIVAGIKRPQEDP